MLPSLLEECVTSLELYELLLIFLSSIFSLLVDSAVHIKLPKFILQKLSLGILLYFNALHFQNLQCSETYDSTVWHSPVSQISVHHPICPQPSHQYASLPHLNTSGNFYSATGNHHHQALNCDLLYLHVLSQKYLPTF